jgi:hypothetical protein
MGRGDHGDHPAWPLRSGLLQEVEGGDTMTYEKPDVESRIDVKGIMGNKGGAGTKSGGGYP